MYRARLTFTILPSPRLLEKGPIRSKFHTDKLDGIYVTPESHRFFIIGADVFHEDRIYKIGQNDKEKIMEFAYEQNGQIVTTTIKTRHNAKPKPGTLENTRKKLPPDDNGSLPSPPPRKQGATLNACRSAGQCLIGNHGK